jgi:hypothetical protein
LGFQGSSFFRSSSGLEEFQSRFGEDLLNKMLGFLSGQSRTQVTEAVEERLRSAARELRALMPITFTSVAGEIKRRDSGPTEDQQEGCLIQVSDLNRMRF